MANPRIRHWKQRFNAEDEFVYMRHCRTVTGAHTVGEYVDKSEYTLVRLRRMWDAHYIQIANWVAPELHDPMKSPEPTKLTREDMVNVPRLNDTVEKLELPGYEDALYDEELKRTFPPKGVVVVDQNGFWYTVIVNGEEKRISGRGKLEKLIAEVGHPEDHGYAKDGLKITAEQAESLKEAALAPEGVVAHPAPKKEVEEEAGEFLEEGDDDGVV